MSLPHRAVHHNFARRYFSGNATGSELDRFDRPATDYSWSLAWKALSLVTKGNSLMDSLPFRPQGHSLRSVLRNDYLVPVANWLLGKNDETILAQEGGSTWEAAICLEVLTDVRRILAENRQEAELESRIRKKCVAVGKWLLTQLTPVGKHGLACWDKVTWDTAVVIRALLVCLANYRDAFTSSDIDQIESAIECSSKWLVESFARWDHEVKYPFGPADVAQIGITLIHLRKDHPELYTRVVSHAASESLVGGDLVVAIVNYLFQVRSESSLVFKQDGGDHAETVTYWWDDYFTTSEVLEALGLFCQFTTTSRDSHKLLAEHRKLLVTLREVIVRACVHLEQGHRNGMWGGPIDTSKVVYAYVMLSRCLPHGGDGRHSLVDPEVHTTFKAIRYLCDEKQRFRDGSFQHSLFLTVFFARALVEVYRHWEPAHCQIDKLYDDVVWHSPMRTTPERAKRMAAELRAAQLKTALRNSTKGIRRLKDRLRRSRTKAVKTIMTVVFAFVAVPAFFLIGFVFNVIEVETKFRKVNEGNLFAFGGVYVPVVLAVIALIWKYDKIFQK